METGKWISGSTSEGIYLQVIRFDEIAAVKVNGFGGRIYLKSGSVIRTPRSVGLRYTALIHNEFEK